MFSDTTQFLKRLEEDAAEVDLEIREGRFQRGLALIAGLSSILGTAEVAYMHYRGSFSRRVMYTPLFCGAALSAAGLWGFASRRAAKTVLPAVSAITLADGLIGFYFHIKGVQRKPGGWRLPVVNIIMGPPLFAPLLFCISAYLGLLAAFMRRGGEAAAFSFPKAANPHHPVRMLPGAKHEQIGWEQDLREGRFQKHMAVATIISAFFSGFEALYSHYKNGFQYKIAQSSPLIVAPALMAAAAGAIRSKRVAHTVLPVVSTIAMVNGGIGGFYHTRGILRRPGGLKKPLYNLLYGPPVFAPLLFAACGFVGLLTSLLRREK